MYKTLVILLKKLTINNKINTTKILKIKIHWSFKKTILNNIIIKLLNIFNILLLIIRNYIFYFIKLKYFVKTFNLQN